MALVDFGYSGKVKDSSEAVLSLETEASRGGYFVRRSVAATKGRFRLAGLAVIAGLSAVAFGALAADQIVTLAAVAGGLASVALGTRAMVRRPVELEVDRRGRAFHLVRRSPSGHPRRTKTVRFEEVIDLEMVDRLSPLDAPAAALSWDMGRIELTWQRGRKLALICGDVSELEPLLGGMRRELNRA